MPATDIVGKPVGQTVQTATNGKLIFHLFSRYKLFVDVSEIFSEEIQFWFLHFLNFVMFQWLRVFLDWTLNKRVRKTYQDVIFSNGVLNILYEKNQCSVICDHKTGTKQASGTKVTLGQQQPTGTRVTSDTQHTQCEYIWIWIHFLGGSVSVKSNQLPRILNLIHFCASTDSQQTWSGGTVAGEQNRQSKWYFHKWNSVVDFW